MSEVPSGSQAPVREVAVRRFTGGTTVDTRDMAAVEEPLEIRLHGRSFAVIMRTPGADRELAAGFLLAEGVVSEADDLGAVEHCRNPEHPELRNVVNAFLIGAAAARLDAVLAERRNVLTNSSCGMCGRVTIDSLTTRAAPIACTCLVASQVISTLPDVLRDRQALFNQTGGLHAAALFTPDGTFVTMAEDVGRHNAVDKVVGRLLLDGRLPLTGHVLVVSGRTSFEIVQKAWLAGIEVVCAVSAPSSLAIELADEAGITLLGFARDQGFNIYTHPQRVGRPAEAGRAR